MEQHDYHDYIDSKFRLVILAAKRARQLLRGGRKKIEMEAENPLTIAMEEINRGLIHYEITDGTPREPDLSIFGDDSAEEENDSGAAEVQDDAAGLSDDDDATGSAGEDEADSPEEEAEEKEAGKDGDPGDTGSAENNEDEAVPGAGEKEEEESAEA